MDTRVALPGDGPERRLAVVDMGSNTFRLVVFSYRPGGSYRLVDEIRDTVRLSQGAGPEGIQPDAIARAAHAAHLYAAFCAAEDIDEIDVVTTSAARDAANRDRVMAALTAGGALPVRVLSEAEEARYGYLGAINSTTLRDGWVLDLGGGSSQATAVVDRRIVRSMSRPLGAVRMTERFLSADITTGDDLDALRTHARDTLAQIPWLADVGERVVGIGGTVRTVARMAQRRRRYPLDELHGYVLERDDLDAVIEEMAATPASQRVRLAGLKADRADITLAGAVVIATTLEHTGAQRIEICSQGLREGVFRERHLAHQDEPLVEDVRRDSVRNLMDAHRCDVSHAEHVARLALEIHRELTRLGLQRPGPRERKVLWAAAMLHDIGVAVDYNDHHKHGHYLVLNSGLPGFPHAELAMIALLVRGHRKALPTTAPFESLLGPDDDDRLARLAACLRIAEQLARSRDVGGVRLEHTGQGLHAAVACAGDPTVALLSAARESPALVAAVGLPLTTGPADG